MASGNMRQQGERWWISLARGSGELVSMAERRRLLSQRDGREAATSDEVREQGGDDDGRVER